MARSTSRSGGSRPTGDSSISTPTRCGTPVVRPATRSTRRTTRATSCSGRGASERPRPTSPRGTLPGARAVRAGTSSAPRWPCTTWARRSTSTRAGSTTSSRTTSTRWPSRRARPARRSRASGCMPRTSSSTAARWRSRSGTSIHSVRCSNGVSALRRSAICCSARTTARSSISRSTAWPPPTAPSPGCGSSASALPRRAAGVARRATAAPASTTTATVWRWPGVSSRRGRRRSKRRWTTTSP
jgi:hypothetical protein